MTKTQTIQETKRTDIFMMDIRLIEVEKLFNVRVDYGDITALANSIHESGLRFPLHIRPNTQKKGYYFLTDGHRRYQAIQQLISDGRWDVNKDRVKALPVPRGFSEEDRILDMFICNDNKPLTFLEQAELVRRLLAKGWSQKEISARIGRDENGVFVGNLVKLLEAPSSLKNKIQQGRISPSLVVDILKKEKDLNNVLFLIEDISQASDKKITRDTINKAKGIDNSLTYFKRILKDAGDDNIKPEMLNVFKIAKGIVEGKYSNIELEKMFLV